MLISFFLFFKKEKKKSCCIYVLLYRVYVSNENSNNIAWFCSSKQDRYFRNAFMIIQLKYHYDSLNTGAVLVHGPEYSSAKCGQFPLIFDE